MLLFIFSLLILALLLCMLPVHLGMRAVEKTLEKATEESGSGAFVMFLLIAAGSAGLVAIALRE